MRSFQWFFLGWLGTCALGLPALQAETRLYISPAGSDDRAMELQDTSVGSSAKPLATVEAAVARARSLRAAGEMPPIVIEIRDGRYELDKALKLTAADSGLTLRASDGAEPVLSGGRRITGWRRDPKREGLWSVKLPEVRAGNWYFHQLFLDDQRLVRARTPNDGFFRAAGPLGKESPIELRYRSGDIKKQWADESDGRLVMLMKWTDLHVPIVAVDPERNIAKLAGGPRPSWMNEPDGRYWVENVPDALDATREWYLDRDSGELRLLLPAGVDPNESRVVAPRLETLLEVEGEADGGQKVRDLKLEGLTFADSDYPMPEHGIISPQAAVPMAGSVQFRHAIDCRLSDCQFRNLGGYGLEIGRGAQQLAIVGNRLEQLGAGGIRVGEPDDRDPSDHDACRGHQITDNTIEHLGRIFAPGCGIIVFQSGSNWIAHNHIRDLYYTGLSVGWHWGYRQTPCRDNLIEYNLVEQVGQGRLSDMGGIYTLGPQPGTVIRNNVFRDVTSYRYGGWGLYTDEGSSGIVMENNVAYRCTDAGFHQHYGRDNVIRNNLLAFNRNHSVMRTRSEDHLSFTFSRNVIVADSGTLLGSNWSGTPEQFRMHHNVWFDQRLGEKTEKYRFAGSTWQQWQARGQGKGSIIADPQLVDPEHPELGLQPDSPAFQVGFEPIDMSPLGPRPVGERTARE